MIDSLSKPIVAYTDLAQLQFTIPVDETLADMTLRDIEALRQKLARISVLHTILMTAAIKKPQLAELIERTLETMADMCHEELQEQADEQQEDESSDEDETSV